MAFSDYTSALSTLRTHLTNEDWAAFEKQLVTCRTWAASLPGSAGIESATVSMAFGQLDKIEQAAAALRASSAANTTRLVMTRTNYASR